MKVRRVGPPEDSKPLDERQQFINWLKGEIKRIEGGGAPPDCWEGTPEECVKDMKRELDDYLNNEPR